MDWIVFGDDWGAHPSTTQHLVRNLPASDRVAWVDSIGMRSPGFNAKDIRRLIAKAASLARRSGRASGADPVSLESDAGFRRILPRVIPFHRNRFAADFNRRAFARAFSGLGEGGAFDAATLLTATPVAALYLDAIPHRHVAYLRLDDYAALPGVDGELVRATETRLYERADTVFATAQSLLPGGPWAHKGRYLPQGVDNLHFGQNVRDPAGRKIVGFFGLVAEWLDFALIAEVARRAPGWQFEFVGPIRHLPDAMKRLPNVAWRGAAPYSELPSAIASWTCAWIPFQVNELTRAVNPLKLREYLAAGLPSHVTPLPEAQPFTDTQGVLVSAAVEDILAWMETSLATDSRVLRDARRARVADDSWVARAAEMRRIVLT